MTYEEILAAARRGSESIDFSRFRFAFTRTNAYAPYDVEALEEDQTLEEAARASDWKSMLAQARAALERCYVRVRPHLYAAAACEALGDAVEQRHHEQCSRGLLTSILNSGDGRTPDTAFVVIGVWEEYDVLNALKLQLTHQALLPVGDRQVDQITVMSPEASAPFNLYFDVTIPKTMLQRGLEELNGSGDE